MLRRFFALLLAPLFATAADAPRPGPLPAIGGEWIVPLDDVGFAAAPIGATDARPIVVGVHGAYDRPDWACSEWRAVFGPRPFIVCPHGDPRPGGGFVWSGAAQIRASAERAIDATVARYGAHVDRAHRVYAGFSQGAILGARVVREDAGTYPYALFEEGFGDELAGHTVAAQVARAGVARVLLGCSQPGCARVREPARAALARAGIDVHVRYAGPLGHTMEPRVIAALRDELPWFLAGDPVWAGVVADAVATPAPPAPP